MGSEEEELRALARELGASDRDLADLHRVIIDLPDDGGRLSAKTSVLEVPGFWTPALTRMSVERAVRLGKGVQRFNETSRSTFYHHWKLPLPNRAEACEFVAWRGLLTRNFDFEFSSKDRPDRKFKTSVFSEYYQMLWDKFFETEGASLLEDLRGCRSLILCDCETVDVHLSTMLGVTRAIMGDVSRFFWDARPCDYCNELVHTFMKPNGTEVPLCMRCYSAHEARSTPQFVH